MEIRKKPEQYKAQKPQSSADIELKKSNDAVGRKVEAGQGNDTRAKAAQAEHELGASRSAEAENLGEVSEIKGLKEQAKQFLSLAMRSVDLMTSYNETRKALQQRVEDEKKELTVDQLHMLAQFDKKADVCRRKMKRLYELMETSIKACRQDQLEKICIAMNICVVDSLDNLVDEYANLMLRIFSEDEDLTAQLKELMLEGTEEGTGEIKSEAEEAKAEPTRTETETTTVEMEEPRPLTWYETITGYFYGYGASASGSDSSNDNTSQPKGE